MTGHSESVFAFIDNLEFMPPTKNSEAARLNLGQEKEDITG